MTHHKGNPRPPIASDRPPARWTHAAVAAALAALAVLSYWPTADGQLIWDDHSYANLPAYQQEGGLAKIWTDPQATPQYYPLTFTSFYLHRRLLGSGPHYASYHLVNLIAQAINVLLVYAVLRRLRVPGGWLAAALFAVHPLNAETVGLVAERKNLLSGMFMLLSLLAYLRFAPPDAQPGRPRRWGFYVLSLALLAMALLSKTVACTLPAVMAVLLWWKRPRLTRRDLLPLAPMLAIALAGAAVTVWVESSHYAASSGHAILPWSQRLLLAGATPWFYAGKVLLPVGLSPVYAKWSIDPTAWRWYLPGVLAVATLVALWAARGRIGRAPLAGALAFVAMLSPVLGLLHIGYFGHSYVADHFVYLAAVPLLALAAGGAAMLWRRLRGANARLAWLTGPAATAAVVLALLAASWQHSKLFADAVTFWRQAKADNPSAVAVRVNLSEALRKRGRLHEAAAELVGALAIDQTSCPAQTGLAFIYAELGNFADAQRHADLAVACDPNGHRGYYIRAEVTRRLAEQALARGQAQRAEGLLAEARADCRHSLRLRQDDPEAWFVQATIEAMLDEPTAGESFAQAIRLNPYDARYYHNRGSMHGRAGRIEQAIADFSRAIELAPDYASAYQNRARAYKLVGQFQRARQDLRQCERLGQPIDLALPEQITQR